jgi:hypothetical protein
MTCHPWEHLTISLLLSNIINNVQGLYHNYIAQHLFSNDTTQIIDNVKHYGVINQQVL